LVRPRPIHTDKKPLKISCHGLFKKEETQSGEEGKGEDDYVKKVWEKGMKKRRKGGIVEGKKGGIEKKRKKI
jgi:hypothetical protein